MAEEIMTFEALYDILRREKYNQELQTLDKNFFEKVVKYLNEKKLILDSQQQKTSIFASTEIDKTKRQLESVNKILKELYEKRENKIIQLSVSFSKTEDKPDLSALLPEEVGFFNSINEILNLYRNGILFKLLSHEVPKISKEDKPKELKSHYKEKENKLLTFIKDIPKFIGDDLCIYGPFQKEDMASLPKEIAEILVSKGGAKEL
ncbi:DNA replication complex GINS family protein [Candidatus Woesearchaeota archaeon]|nr:DNA replication complex GINS family protein [Candidatus Woesearchaeota archaeon]